MHYKIANVTGLFSLKTFKALNGLLCADVPLRNYSLTHSVGKKQTEPSRTIGIQIKKLATVHWALV